MGKNKLGFSFLYFIGLFKVRIFVRFLDRRLELDPDDAITRGAFGDIYAVKTETDEVSCVKVIRLKNESEGYLVLQEAIREFGMLHIAD